MHSRKTTEHLLDWDSKVRVQTAKRSGRKGLWVATCNSECGKSHIFDLNFLIWFNLISLFRNFAKLQKFLDRGIYQRPDRWIACHGTLYQRQAFLKILQDRARPSKILPRLPIETRSWQGKQDKNTSEKVLLGTREDPVSSSFGLN